MRRFDSYLSYVPSQKETWDFIHSFSNLKHKAILSLMYSAGLRVGEVCALRYEDISRSSMRIHILKDGVAFKDLGDYYNQFNKERKIKAYLKKLKALGWEAPVVAA